MTDDGCQKEIKREWRALGQWVLEIGSERVVMESTGVYWKNQFTAPEGGGHLCLGGQCAACQGRTRSQDRQDRCAVVDHDGRCRLLRASFIPPVQLCLLRLVACASGKRCWDAGSGVKHGIEL